MSKENVKKFYQEVAEDEGLRTRLRELFKEYQGQTMDEAKETALMEKLVLPIAAEMGLPFTMEDLLQYKKEMAQTNVNRELDDNELEAVAGGLFDIGGYVCFFIGGGAAIGDGACIGLGVSF